MKVCMIVPDETVRGGIASVVQGYREEMPSRCDVRFIPSYVQGNKGQKLRQGLRAYGAFLRQILSDRPDITHIHASFGASFWRKLPILLMARMARIPVAYHVHGAEFGAFYGSVPRWKRALIRWAYGLCTRVIALSEEWRETLAQIVPGEKISVLENYGVETPGPFRRAGKTVLFLGEIGQRKGCFDLPDVAARVAESLPDARFVLGGDGDIDRLQAAFTARGLAERVCFPGWLRGDSKAEALRTADVFLLPSYGEGMPMAILDAMGASLPVVATRVGGIPQLVMEGENGFLCAPGDTEKIAQGLISLLTDEPLRLRMGERGLALLRERYALNVHLDKLTAIYAQCLEETP